MVFISQRRLLNGWEIGRHDLGTGHSSCSFIGEQQRWAHSPGIPRTPWITLLTFSSVVASIFYLAFPTILQGRKPARQAFSSCLKKYLPSFISHCQASVPCKTSSLQYLDHGLRGCHPSHPHPRWLILTHPQRSISCCCFAHHSPSSHRLPRPHTLLQLRRSLRR